MNYRTRLLLVSSLAVAAAMVVASMTIFLVVRSELYGQVDTYLRDRGRTSVAAYRLQPESSRQFGWRQPQLGASLAAPIGAPAVPATAPAPGTGPAGGGAGSTFGFGGPDTGGPGPDPDAGQGSSSNRFMLPGGPAGGAGGVSQVVDRSGKVDRPERPRFSAAEEARRRQDLRRFPASLRRQFRDGQVSLRVSDTTRAVAAGRHDAFFGDQTVRGVHYRVYTVSLGDGHAAQIARPVDEIDRVLHRLVRLLIAIVAGGIVLAVLFGLLVTRAASLPIRRLTIAAERVATERDLSHRIAIGGAGNDDLTQLAVRFNDMLAALEASERSQRQLVEDAEHELRTPLASLRMNIEVLVRGESRLPPDDRANLLRDLTQQVDELAVLVEDLVEMARSGANDVQPERVRLDELVADAVARVRRTYPDTTFDVDLEPVQVTGHSDQINRAIGNLLANAARHGGADGPVEVQLRGNGVVQVRDHGPGIDDEEKLRVFERFYRAREARDRPGSGLGLAIVRRVADAHRGDVWVEDADGGGSAFHLQLPVDRAAS